MVLYDCLGESDVLVFWFLVCLVLINVVCGSSGLVFLMNMLLLLVMVIGILCLLVRVL